MEFTEGPSWHPNGYLVFSDVNANTIYRWDEVNGLQVFDASSQGANGTVVNKKNELIYCRQTARDIAKRDTNGVINSFVSTYNGKKYNSPNDLTLSYLGSIYFTDPDFGANTSGRELNYEGLYCIPYYSSNAILFDSTLIKPNGLTFSYDSKTLFVAESSTNKIYSYALRDDLLSDITKDKKLFLTVNSGEIDGITGDIFGNLYVACGNNGVKIYNKDAQQIGSISFPTNVKVRNLTLGGKYKNILFITAGTSLYKVDIRFFGDFVAQGLLAAPTDTSVIFNAISDKPLDAYIEYGTSFGNYSAQTQVKNFAANTTLRILIHQLSPNTRYYYQLKYKEQDSVLYKNGVSGSFMTQRSKGSSFSFAVEADPHLDEASSTLTFQKTLQNAKEKQADFLIDLGDNFLTEKFPIVDRYYIEQRNLLYRNFWDPVCSSMPLYLVIGNHEGELGWRTSNQADDMYNLTTTIRKEIYDNPEPNGFYTGSETLAPFVGKRQNYYAWNWGDALFVVIDPYSYTDTKTNSWSYTLGKTQYDWFRSTLENSTAKYKFVFAHQIVGGDASGRGGVEYADKYENGGKNADGTYGFDAMRPGWGKPLHQIMVENGVQIYFHGHDHLYAMQELDGVVYQEVPQPSFPSYTNVSYAADYGYVNGTILPNSGHLNVQILGDSALVEYIGGYHVDDTKKGLYNGEVRHSYYVKANGTNTGVGIIESQPLKIIQMGNRVLIQSENTLVKKVSLFNTTGQSVGVISNGKYILGNNYVDLPSNLHGLYLLSVQTESSIITKKIFIP